MDAVLLARLQFAITIGFHFIFAPLTIGLSWLILWVMTRYVRTGEERYKRMARFWVSIFALSFAVGVATGITMEFQFGTNWANYSRLVGGIFGPPLAAETITSFFLESVFVGLLIFGWDRVSRNIMWFASLMVAVGSTLSAFWILVANSWMQTPAGYQMVGNRAVLTDFWAAVFNPSTIPRVLHTVDGALMTGAFFMLGISALLLLKRRSEESARICLTLALVVAFATSVIQILFGHIHAIQVTYTQPAKLAAIEGLFETQRHAPLLIFGIPDAKRETTHFAIRVPGMLSFIATGRTDSEIRGLKSFPKDQWPPLVLTFLPFHLMFLIGLFLPAFAAAGVILLWMRRLYNNRFFLFCCWAIIPLPFLANELGWMTAEVGRQPWIVYQQFRTSASISVSVPAEQVLASMVLLSVVYALLFVIWYQFVQRAVGRGMDGMETLPAPETTK